MDNSIIAVPSKLDVLCFVVRWNIEDCLSRTEETENSLAAEGLTRFGGNNRK